MLEAIASDREMTAVEQRPDPLQAGTAAHPEPQLETAILPDSGVAPQGAEGAQLTAVAPSPDPLDSILSSLFSWGFKQ
jgi:hypothetical protein